mgnify:CR=1 FL=1
MIHVLWVMVVRVAVGVFVVRPLTCFCLSFFSVEFRVGI